MNAFQENQVRWWDFPAALILVVAVFLTSIRLNATNWTDELTIIQTITIFAVVTGLALGQSSFSPRVSAWFSAAYGAFFIIWQLGLTFGDGFLWSERLTNLFGRLGFSLENLFRQRAVTDPIMFLFLMAILFWLLSAHAGYTLTRYANAWRAVLPLGVALFIVHIHDPYWTSRSWFLAGYIFLALLLASRTNFLHKRLEWRQTRTHMPPFVGLDFLRTTMVVGGALILLAWTAPALAANLPPAQEAWQTVARPWYEARAKMTNAFASLRATVGVAQDYYGDILPLGRGNTLTDAIIFTVDAPPRPAAGVRYYWRARVYETWTGTGWSADPTDFIKIQPDQANLVMPNLEGRWEADFTFTAYTSMVTVHTVPQPLWVSRPATAELLQNADGIADILRLTTSTIRPGEQYQVHSSLTNVTEAELRAAGTAYPEYITERYLQIPETITRRTRDLAADIAGAADNPYDRVIAVTQWLRENITYQETMPVPPQNRDIIDWMLFDLNQGFCNYYATAEIMMLRSLGIPARLAVGYAQGQRDPETNIYTVRQRDAHAWPEVFFPGIGWVEFEPTLNQRPLRRPAGDPINENNTASPAGTGDNSIDQADLEALLGFERQEDQPLLDQDQAPEEAAPETITTSWAWLAAAGTLILGATAYTWYRGRVNDPRDPMTPLSIRVELQLRKTRFKAPSFLLRMARQAALPLEARAYEQINRSLRWLGKIQEPSRTPAERADELIRLLPGSAGTIHSLLDTYHHTMYFSTNGHASTEESRLAAVQNARVLRNQTLVTIFRKTFARFQEPPQRKPIA